MLTAATAQDVADAYGLGGPATLTGPVARGQLGQVWRLDTEAGTHAVKEWFATPDLAAMSRDADLVAAALAEGVVTPRIVHTTTGAVATTVADTAIRVFEWVDLRGPDAWPRPLRRRAHPRGTAPGRAADGRARRQLVRDRPRRAALA